MSCRSCVSALLLMALSCDREDSSGAAQAPPKGVAAAAKVDDAKSPAPAKKEAATKADAKSPAPSKMPASEAAPPIPATPAAEAEVEKVEEVPTRPVPGALAPPTEEELAAWARKDPAGEKALYKWDEANLDAMLGYWEDLQCFRAAVVEAGDEVAGAAPGSPAEEAWFQFKVRFVKDVDGWQKRIFAAHPRIVEKSKYIGSLLEAHEIVMSMYPKAFNDGDTEAIAEASAYWDAVEAKVEKYTKTIGGTWPDHGADAAAKAAHAKHCAELLSK